MAVPSLKPGWWGNAAHAKGDYARARVLHEESLALKRELGDKRGMAFSLSNLGAVAYDRGYYNRAREFFEESLILRRELEDTHGIAASLTNLGSIAYSQCDYEQARTLHEEGLSLCRELGEKQHILGNVAYAEGDDRGAAELYEESLALSWEVGDKRWASWSLEGLARVSCDQGQAKRAARLFGAAKALREAIGVPLPPSEHADYERHVAAVRARLKKEAFV